jgi:hypothetical protein
MIFKLSSLANLFILIQYLGVGVESTRVEPSRVGSWSSPEIIRPG